MALKGLKVIELAGMAPSPVCGMILSDLMIFLDQIKNEDNIFTLVNIELGLEDNPEGIIYIYIYIETID